MNINNNLNSMIQLEKQLEESTAKLAKLNNTSANAHDNGTNLENNQAKQDKIEPQEEVNLANEIVKQIELPIAYSVNANVVSVQNATHQALLDIKA